MANPWAHVHPAVTSGEGDEFALVQLSPICAPAAEASIAASSYREGPGGCTASAEWTRLVDVHSTGANVHLVRNLLFALIETRELVEGQWTADLIEQDRAIERELRRVLLGRNDVHALQARS